MDLERAYYQGEPHLLPEGSALRLPIFCLWTGLQALSQDLDLGG